LATVTRLPPLVHPGEVDSLKAQLARAARGEAFLLQGGDCAERFQDCHRNSIENKLKILLQMSLVLTWGARIPTIRVGRIAGQYAKPRSSPFEIIDGVKVPSYRGDHVNSYGLEARQPDPDRLVQAYFHSAATLNYVRALLDGGFADLHKPQTWDLGFVRSPTRRADYERMVARIADALEFVEATGIQTRNATGQVDLFSSHEGLLLEYEQAMTEKVGDRWYNLGSHFQWIGDRTRQVDGAHVDYFRGITNPMGIKVGPTMAPDELIELMVALNPDDEPGRLTLITRFGADRIDQKLPPLIEAVKNSGRTVVWSCDPMHGNTQKTSVGVKTRDFDRILDELDQAFTLHQACGTRMSGVHFELTGDDVTECTGGPQEIRESDLSRAYETYCDPRLNYAQGHEMAFLIARALQDFRTA
jgi:3-deoxy-7-phosphoheptulonate synthase